jgi:DnaJ-domain-containing protein 1
MTDLSPEAQAILDAYQFAPIEDELTAAAVLRAAADQLDHPTSAHTLYAFADELETVTSSSQLQI